MLNFYTHINQLTPENRKRVFPMLFDWFYLEHPVVLEYFKLVNTLEEASVFILPIDVGYYFSNNKKNEVDSFIALAKENNKQVWIYSAGDFGITLNSNIITFRLGGFTSKMNNQTYILPSFVNDPYDTIYKKEWQPIVKEEKPTIGFVGNADGSFIKWSKEFLIYTKQQIKRLLKKDYSDSQSFFPSSSKRYKLLEKLKRNKGINATFIYRNKYRAGAVTREQKEKTTLAFYENIEQNLYIFCLRGSGNFSVRFYETLIMGRIPLLIDTDVRLPFHDTINWNEHCILATSENFVDKIIAFHKNHTTKELIEIQEKIGN
ncbi:MAG: exostosin family protein [Flavobacterium sp.]|nr:exostosin family protein [Flavobacterium sp.]